MLLVALILLVTGGDDSKDAASETTEAPAESIAPIATTEAPVTTDAPSGTEAPVDSEAPVETDLPPSSDSLPGAPEGVRGNRSSPVPTGTIADIGSGYRLQVISVTDDATAEILSENEFNDPPPAGARFTIVSVTLGYYGKDDPQAGFSTSISAVGADSTGLDMNCGVIPNELNQYDDMFGGGVIRGNLCFITTEADTGMLQLYASVAFGDEVFLDANVTPTEIADMPTLVGIQEGTSSGTARRSPNPIGAAVDVGDGWSLTVTGPVSDITGSVVAVNEFNDPPPDGFAFVGVPIRMDFSGPGSSNAFAVTTKAVGDSNVEYGTECGVIPGELDAFTDVFEGGSLEGQVCFVVPTDEVASMRLYAGAFFDDVVFFATG